MIAVTPKIPYYAVIFTSIMTVGENGYNEASVRMLKLVSEQEGFLGVESARNEIGITVSYLESLEAIKNWKMHMEHSQVREKGRSVWYQNFKVRICKVEREYEFEK